MVLQGQLCSLHWLKDSEKEQLYKKRVDLFYSLQFIYMIIEEMEIDFWLQSIFPRFSWHFVIAIFHSLGLNICVLLLVKVKKLVL